MVKKKLSTYNYEWRLFKFARASKKLCSLHTRNRGPCGRLLRAMISLDLWKAAPGVASRLGAPLAGTIKGLCYLLYVAPSLPRR